MFLVAIFIVAKKCDNKTTVLQLVMNALKCDEYIQWNTTQ